jgi:hypothetical protein
MGVLLVDWTLCPMFQGWDDPHSREGIYHNAWERERSVA